MKPQYTITSDILTRLSEISRKFGLIEGAELVKPPISLRRDNRIKTISSTLQIEENTMTLEQITDLLDGKRILAPQKDITEVKNAVEVYDRFGLYDPLSLKSLCDAHRLLMKDLIPDAGKLRAGNVGIAKGDDIAFIAPPAALVRPHLNNLLSYLKKDKDPMIIKSCVFHYEFEYIHPFSDGNGRMGRLWQSLLLSRYNPVFEYLPIELLIKQRQDQYYKVFDISHAANQSTVFIEFMLSVIDASLDDIIRRVNMPVGSAERINIFMDSLTAEDFSRQDYLNFWPSLSPTSASRDMKYGVDHDILLRSGEKNKARYRRK
ncbi:MAG: Fic family protein [Rikenellaceae bacterium]|nr:Fic family protein [Rikenellaceae bacterium]